MNDTPHQVIFEFRRIGGSVKVSAIDPISNTEVSIVGPAKASQASLKEVAVRKLRQAIARANRAREAENDKA